MRDGSIPFISLNIKGKCVPTSAFAEAQMLLVLPDVVGQRWSLFKTGCAESFVPSMRCSGLHCLSLPAERHGLWCSLVTPRNGDFWYC